MTYLKIKTFYATYISIIFRLLNTTYLKNKFLLCCVFV